MRADIAELKSDMAVVKATLREHSADLREIKTILGLTIETVAELTESQPHPLTMGLTSPEARRTETETVRE